MVFYPIKDILFKPHLDCSLQMLSIWTSLNFFHMVTYYPFPKPAFVCSISLFKTLWKKENLLTTGNFSFSTVFSIHLGNFLLVSIRLSVCPSVHPSVSLFSCLQDKVYIFAWIFMKLTQFAYLINSLNSIDFQKNLTIIMGKVAILS